VDRWSWKLCNVILTVCEFIWSSFTRFEVLIVVNINITLLPCDIWLVNRYQCFRGTCHFNFRVDELADRGQTVHDGGKRVSGSGSASGLWVNQFKLVILGRAVLWMGKKRRNVGRKVRKTVKNIYIYKTPNWHIPEDCTCSSMAMLILNKMLVHYAYLQCIIRH
jgi:hypothetical protein